jgi:hypothetical protein
MRACWRCMLGLVYVTVSYQYAWDSCSCTRKAALKSQSLNTRLVICNIAAHHASFRGNSTILHKSIAYKSPVITHTPSRIYQNSFLSSLASLANRFLHVHPLRATCRSFSRLVRCDFGAGASRARRCAWFTGIEKLAYQHQSSGVVEETWWSTYRSANAFLVHFDGSSARNLCISATTSPVKLFTTSRPWPCAVTFRFVNGAPACSLVRTSRAPRVHLRTSGTTPVV